MFKRLLCALRGHDLVFHRNIYGDEANFTRGRSLYRCQHCDAYLNGAYLHPEKWEQERDQKIIAGLRERLGVCRKILVPWMTQVVSAEYVAAGAFTQAQTVLATLAPGPHEWEMTGDPIANPMWECKWCPAKTNNAVLLMSHVGQECPGRS